METDLQTLREWDIGGSPKTYRTQSVKGWAAVALLGLAAFSYLGRGAFPFLFPGVFVAALMGGLALFVWGSVRYQADAAKQDELERHCPRCGKEMAEFVFDMPREGLATARLSKVQLMHQFIVKDDLYQGSDGRIYMTGKRQPTPGMGYVTWKPAVFLLRQKWFACPRCRVSFVQDTALERVAKDIEEVDALKARQRIS